MLRKLRGALGTAVTWAVAWALSGFALIGTLFAVSPTLDGGLFWTMARPFTLLAGVSGLVGGAAFSAVLGTIHRRRQLRDLSPSRMGLWGALAGLLAPMGVLGFALLTGLPLEANVVGTTILTIGSLGAATAAGTVKLAQMSEGQLNGADPADRLKPGE